MMLNQSFTTRIAENPKKEGRDVNVVNFQWLEKSFKKFPMIGKKDGKVSNGWKMG